MKESQVERAIWIDFEGTRTDPPSMLGVLRPLSDGGTTLTRYVFDDGLRLATESGNDSSVVMADLKPTLADLVRLSDRERCHLVSWSLYDYNVIVEQLGPIAVRYRNAISSAKDWRDGRTQLSPELPTVEFPGEELQRYLRFVGYEVDDDVQSGAATWIRTVRKRSAKKASWSEVSPGGKDAWRRLLEHNAHDLYGMRHVVRHSVGLESSGP